MPQVKSYTNGVFCWCEASTTDQPAAKEFYSKVFGWSVMDTPYGPDAYYTTFMKNQDAVAGMSTLDAAQRENGVPSHWNLYINVDSVDASTAKAAELGAQILAPGFDVMEVGRMSIIQDPCGAVVCLWQKGNHIGATVTDEHAAFCWYELAVKDTAKAKDFYGALFGWQASDSPEYTEFSLGAERIGGMMSIPDVPPNWMPYVMVDNCDASAEAAVQAGGMILIGPGQAGEHGRFCILLDPQGAAFGIYQRLG